MSARTIVENWKDIAAFPGAKAVLSTVTRA